MTSIQLIHAALLGLAVLLTGCGEPGANPPSAAETTEHDPHDEHDDKARVVEISAETAQEAGIEVDVAAPARIRQLLKLYGTVQPNAEQMRIVTARYPGIIRSVTKAVGDAVREGDVLATIESNESLQTYPVVAPLAGVVTARKANPGEYAGESELFMVADLATVWVELALFPRDLPKVRVGQTVRVRSVDGDLQADGKIVYVAPLGHAASQTLTARILLDNAQRRWAPGLYVTGEVALSETEVPVAVRSDAIQSIGRDAVVFVQGAEGFSAQPIALGQSDGDYAEVRGGLAAGDRYAAANSFVLKSELGKGEADHDH